MLNISLKPNAMGKILTVNNRDTGKRLYWLRSPCCSSLFAAGLPQLIGPHRPTFRHPFLFVRSWAESKL
jgi:hypothetical protein